MLGCLGYMVNVFGELLVHGYPQMSAATYASLPASFGEIGTCLWLLLVGARVRPNSSFKPTPLRGSA
jgi:hypothetical protein